MQGKAWTTEEINKLKSIVIDNIPCVIEGRTPSAIKKKIQDLGLNKYIYANWSELNSNQIKNIYRRRPRLYWSDKDIKRLEKACSESHSARSIYKHKLLPEHYTINAIQKKMCMLGLAKKLKKYKKFDYMTRFIFIKFLEDNWVGNTPEELTYMWNNKYLTQPISKRRVIKYLTVLGKKVSYVEIGHIKRLKEYEKQIRRNASNMPLSEVVERIKAKRIELMARRFNANKDIWTGLENVELIDMNE